MLRRACIAIFACSVVAACSPERSEPDPDLSTARSVTWTNTAKELSGGKAKARIYGFGQNGNGGPTSAASGDLVLSQTWTDSVATVVAQDAATGQMRWRQDLPIGRDGWADCNDDQGGPVFACKVGKPKSATLWVMVDRTGVVRKRIPVAPDVAFGISGDDLYLVHFRPTRKNTKLNVDVERRSWATGKTAWRQNTSFAIEGWGHDGGSGFEFGKNRVAAYSASWQVVLDPQTGRLLDRSDNGRSEAELSSGGRLVVDSGDGTSDYVRATLFSPDGRPISEIKDATYPSVYEVKPDRMVIGRRVLSVSAGRTIFTAPRKTRIIELVDHGRFAVVEPDDLEFANNLIPLTVFDTSTGKKTGTVVLKGNISEASVAGGYGVIKVVKHYDDKSGTSSPPMLQVIDVRRPASVATVVLGRKPDDYGGPTLVKTSAGFAVTDEGSVRGFVAKD